MVSIIIRTYNEEKYLRSLLESIITQSYHDYEIIVVDSGSVDSTLEIIEDFSVKLVRIEKEDFTFGRSLNYGCREALGDQFVFISAHCIPTSNDWLEKMIDPFSNEKVAMVYGRQVGFETSHFSELQVFNKYFPPNAEDQQGGFFCNNANSAIRASLWIENSFDENLTGLEDMAWAKNIYYKGFSIVYASDACIYHIHEESWRKVKMRYEREAYALKEIMPEIHFKFQDFLAASIKGIANDIKKNVSKYYFPKDVINIIFFRFCQFYGSYRGNHIHRKLSKRKKQKYFYP